MQLKPAVQLAFLHKTFYRNAVAFGGKMYLPRSMPKQQAKLPAGIPYIMGNEIAERFSFYGMSAILTTFLVKQFFNPSGDPSLSTVANAQSSNMVHLFFTRLFLPVLGGLLADWFWGNTKPSFTCR